MSGTPSPPTPPQTASPRGASLALLALESGAGWPPFCSLAELARMLTMMHGNQAPTESSLKKWSAAGEFDRCVATDQSAAASPEPRAFTREDLLRRGKRAGRPGLRLDTRAAIARVYELWPHLTDTGSQAVLDLAVARVAEGSSHDSPRSHLPRERPPLPPTRASAPVQVRGGDLVPTPHRADLQRPATRPSRR